MVNLYKVVVKAERVDTFPYEHTYIYTGTAGNPSIAERAALRQAKKEGLYRVHTELIEFLGEKEFGR